ncbi:DUF4062 domain-containing protein [Sinorhizobium medicae]|uniref:DUF7779 domain-containing protein n=1 Tax=Sinorhizobium medicae TaxID=110321 RepID=UPI001AADC318|nr:tetratricopeptide repeat protein [Sinorhizobium medicae]MBO1944613.1 hypothetical protein [Sinorhizobium medicae]MDX0869753.1 DUF4062 domain-containing protein [Sinorhizobium medicae]
MAGKTRRCFVSGVSSEFGHVRDEIANDLQAHSYDVAVQRSFGTDPWAPSLLAMLHDFIKDCDCVVALIGSRSGDCPPDEAAVVYADILPEGFARASYTQWEVFFAEAHGKPVAYLRARPNFVPRDAGPSGADFPDLQAAHICRLERLNRYMPEFSDTAEACRHVGRVRWEFADAAAGAPRHKPRNLPLGSIGALFKGREEFLSELRASFERSSATAITGKVMHGLGGIGKTRAAIEYGLKHEKEYSALLFVTANSPEELASNLAALVGPLVLDLPQQNNGQEEVRLAAVLRWLGDHPRWFLLIDNVDTEAAATAVEEMLARLSGGHVLITSRVGAWSHQVDALELDLLALGSAVEYLLEATPGRRRTATDREDAAKLSKTLGHLSLALAQAAAYIDRRRLTFAAYLEAWESARRKLLETHDPRQLAYPFSVAATWLTTFEQLSESARDLLGLLAFLSIEPIPESLCDAVPEDVRDEFDLFAALAELGRYSLVSRDRDRPEFTVHRLVQAVARDSLNEDEQRLTINTVVNWLSWAVRHLDPGDIWSGIEPLQPHLKVAFAHLERLEPGAMEGLAWVTSNSGKLRGEKVLDRQTEPMFRQALAILAKNYGSDSALAAPLLEKFGELLLNANRLDEAEAILRRALEISERGGLMGSFVAVDVNRNLANLFLAAGRIDEAETALKRSLQALLTLAVRGGGRPVGLMTTVHDYVAVLENRGKSPSESCAIIDALFREAGVEPPRRDCQEDSA